MWDGFKFADEKPGALEGQTPGIVIDSDSGRDQPQEMQIPVGNDGQMDEQAEGRCKVLVFPTKRRQDFFGIKQTCLELRAEYSHLIYYVDFSEHDVKFKYSSSASNPKYAKDVAEFEGAVESLSLITREREIMATIPR